MKAIAISCYDKFQDVRILVDIIRENWEDDYYIAVCSSHKEAEKRLSDVDVDSLQTTDIPFSPEWEGNKREIYLYSRIGDQVIKSISSCLDAEADYVMHLHADAWPLNEDKLDDLIIGMTKRGASIGVRGDGWSFRNPGARVGHLMDHFMLIDGEEARSEDLFNFNPMDYMPDSSIHTILALRFLGVLGMSRVWFYSKRDNDLYWDGKPAKNTCRPAVFCPKWDLFHAAEDEFPGTLGEEVQAHFLRQNNLTKGKHLSHFISQYNRDFDEVCSELSRIESRLDRQCKILLESKEHHERLFKSKMDVAEMKVTDKLNRFVRNLVLKSYYISHEIFFKLARWRDPKFNVGRGQKLYEDAEWPEDLSSIYSSNVDLDEFPKEYKKPWFVESR